MYVVEQSLDTAYRPNWYSQPGVEMGVAKGRARVGNLLGSWRRDSTYDPTGGPYNPPPSCSCNGCAPRPCRRRGGRSRRSPGSGCRWCRGRTGRSSPCGRKPGRHTFLGIPESPQPGLGLEMQFIKDELLKILKIYLKYQRKGFSYF